LSFPEARDRKRGFVSLRWEARLPVNGPTACDDSNFTLDDIRLVAAR
jgi:hypothetical protein